MGENKLGRNVLNQNPLEKRVVITGIGTINPLGNNVEEYWENLTKGKSGARLATNMNLDDYHVKIAAQVDLPDVSEYFSSKKMVRRLDNYIVFGHIAGSQAIKDSGLDVDADPTRIGVLIGSGDGGIGTHYLNAGNIHKSGISSVSPFYVISAIPNTASAYLAMEWNIQGPSFAVSSACATANHAFGVATYMIKMGMADAIFTGGAEAPVNPSAMGGFGNIMALSDRNDSPETASRPFDIDRNGFLLSEGAGVLCLEELEHAKKRGAKIYGEIAGFGFTTDAYDLVAPHPEAKGATAAIKAALESSGLNPEDIDLVNAHGTSTPIGDVVEGRGINQAFGDYGNKVLVHSTKSMTGHLLGAAGAVEAIAEILALGKGIVHPSINLFKQDPAIDLTIVTETREVHDIKHIISNAFGFGGQNACVVFSKFTG